MSTIASSPSATSEAPCMRTLQDGNGKTLSLQRIEGYERGLKLAVFSVVQRVESPFGPRDNVVDYLTATATPEFGEKGNGYRVIVNAPISKIILSGDRLVQRDEIESTQEFLAEKALQLIESGSR